MRLRELFEAPQKRTAVVAFGRMNPPTIGHQKLVEALKSHNGDHYVFLSQSQKPKTDPLPFTDKLRYAKFFFPEITIGHPDVRTPMDMMVMLQNLGYTDIIYVAGSDRVEGFKKLFNDYNGKPDKSGKIGYTFDSIEVVSAGERDPDADGAEGMSASKMRQAAADGDLESFTQGTPRPEVAEEMFAAVRQGMGVKDEVVAENNVKGSLPQKIDVVPMPTPPAAPTADTPDGTDDNGTRTSTTPKGNRSVKNGGGTYIFTPQGKLMLYMSPKIGGLQQTHNLTKKTVTVNFGTSVDQGDGDVNVSQKGTYDMQGNLISQDNTNVASGGFSIDLDKDKGQTINYRVSDRDTVSANSRTGVSIRRNDADGNPIQAASNGSR